MALNWNRGGSGMGAQRSELGDSLGSNKVRREQKLAGLRLRDGTKVRGTIHVPPYCRPMDLLNSREETFMAVTDATLTEPDGASQDLPFVAVSKSDIIFLYELKP